jgi:putative endonuclease
VFFVYILYSASADRFYIGHTDDVERRLMEHNSVDKNTYTSRYRPWVLAGKFRVSESRGEAKKTENYLKRLKSRKIIENLIQNPIDFENILTRVRAVPTSRD